MFTYAAALSQAMPAAYENQALEWFSNDNAMWKEDGISRGIVWTRLPVSLLTSSGQVHFTFTTAFSVFSRREDNAADFVCILVGKGRKILPNT